MPKSLNELTIEYSKKVLTFSRDLIDLFETTGDREAAALALSVRLSETIDDFVQGK